MPDLSERYEDGFLFLLLILATGGLYWLFQPFLPGLFLAVLLASSTWSIQRLLRERHQLTPDTAALVMTVLVGLLVVSPLIYLLTATGWRLAQGVAELKLWIAQMREAGNLNEILAAHLAALPIPGDFRAMLVEAAMEHKAQLGDLAARLVMVLFQGVTGNAASFFSSLVLILFSLFFFYRDGGAILTRIKILTPLSNRYDEMIFRRFSALASVLTLSTLCIALLQGSAFALVAAFMGLPWFYLGVGIAVTSFVPLVGGLIVWGPTAWYLFHQNHYFMAAFLAAWGAVVIGFVMDNLFRPYLIGKLAQWQSPTGDTAKTEAGLLHHTLLTVLATLGGILQFGILGLFFGPIMAAMAITIYDVYELKCRDWLDRS